MENKMAIMPLDDYKNVCDKIREKTGTNEKINSSTLVEKIEEVYNVGYEVGINSDTLEPTVITKQGNPIIINDILNMPYDLKISLPSNLEIPSDTMVIKCGHNLFDGNLEAGYIHLDTGVNVPNANYVRTANYISIIPDTQFRIIKYDGGIHKTYFRFYDKDKKYITFITASASDDMYFTSPENAEYLRIYFDNCRDFNKKFIVTLAQLEPVDEYSGELEYFIPDNEGKIKDTVHSLYPTTILLTNNDENIVTEYIEYTSFDYDNYRLGLEKSHSILWDTIQDNGKRVDYGYAFKFSWNDKTFKPKYNICPEGETAQMFHTSPISNIKKELEECGVIMDFSKVTKMNGTFQQAKTKELPILDLSSCTVIQLGLYNMENIKELTIINLRENCSFDRALGYCYSLEELNISGTIGKSGLDFKNSGKLTKTSWYSVINALSTTTTGLSITGSLTSVKKAFETSPGANDGDTSTEWLELQNSRSNWTISLA